jgi:short-subunit dehydrogenase
MARRNLENARILLTGASSGIGRAIALELARRRATLLLTARRAELLDSLAAECVALGATVRTLPGDAADAEFRRSLIEHAQQEFGGLDVLVNNAGTSAHGRFAASDEPTLRQIMEVNFFAPVELTRLALPLLRQGRRAAVMNVASILGHHGAPFNSEYSASKFALRGWSEALRAELASEGIDVLLVSPGATQTELFDHLIVKRSDLPWKAQTISAEAAARQTVRALEKGRREIFPNWRGRALVLANRAFPGLIDRVMSNYGRRAAPSQESE